MYGLQIDAQSEAQEQTMPQVPMAVPSNESILESISSYSRFYWCQMRAQGFQMELEDVEGELGVVYAMALKRYNSQSPAAFGTYLYRAFENRIKTLKTEMAKAWVMPVVALEGGDVVDPDTLRDAVDSIDERAAQKRFLANLTGRQAMIFDELTAPSDAVVEHMRTMKGRTIHSKQVSAICAVHGLGRGEFYEAVKVFKEQHFLLDKGSVSA